MAHNSRISLVGTVFSKYFFSTLVYDIRVSKRIFFALNFQATEKFRTSQLFIRTSQFEEKNVQY